jgi:dihydrodipicolinate synthase/N-acetylneuraminate lyase
MCTMTTPNEQTISQVMAEMGRRGAAARVANTTPEQRSEVARKAAVKRWRAARKKKREKNS